MAKLLDPNEFELQEQLVVLNRVSKTVKPAGTVNSSPEVISSTPISDRCP